MVCFSNKEGSYSIGTTPKRILGFDLHKEEDLHKDENIRVSRIENIKIY